MKSHFFNRPEVIAILKKANIDFNIPDGIILTPCKLRSYTELTHTRHGIIKRVIQLPASWNNIGKRKVGKRR
jgi:hypothetical protein